MNYEHDRKNAFTATQITRRIIQYFLYLTFNILHYKTKNAQLAASNIIQSTVMDRPILKRRPVSLNYSKRTSLLMKQSSHIRARLLVQHTNTRLTRI